MTTMTHDHDDLIHHDDHHTPDTKKIDLMRMRAVVGGGTCAVERGPGTGRSHPGSWRAAGSLMR